MTGFLQIQDTLDRVLGTGPMPNHKAFWRGKTRDEFVSEVVFGFAIIVVNRPEESNLVRALRGLAPFGADLIPPPPGAIFRRMPAGRPAALEADIVLIEDWIRDGCPEVSPLMSGLTAGAGAVVTNDTHVRYWRAMDDFFLPGLASAETAAHVGRMHAAAFVQWLPAMLPGGSPSGWQSYLANPDVAASFNYIRHHQRRLIQEFYGGSSENIFDSLWKFGGNLLPTDPLSHARPEHTMNGLRDWFFWCPYLDASLRAQDATSVDQELARAWQMGIVADGLLRTDSDRPPQGRMPIPDFQTGDPNLREKVTTRYSNADSTTLIPEMVRRARESRLFA